MKTAHTPGPWTWEEQDSTTTNLVAPSGLVLSIYESHGGGTLPSDADRCAIAAVPDLLDALRVAVETIRIWHGFGASPDIDVAEAWALYQQSPEMRTITAAIQKAEGR